MDMTRRLGRAAVSIVAVIGVMFGMVGVANATTWNDKIREAKSKARAAATAPKLIHPCDVGNDNGRLDASIERLCMKVWKQDAYTISDKHGNVYQESPAGPTIVVDLVQQWQDEDAGIIWLRTGFENERDMYAKRDR